MRRALCLVAASLCLSCGGSPTSPASVIDRVRLPTGAFLLFLSATAPPAACLPPSGSPIVGMFSRVTLVHEGTEWIARSTAAIDGDIELRFRDSGGQQLGQFVPVTGTIRGRASDAGYQLTVPFSSSLATVTINPAQPSTSFFGQAVNDTPNSIYLLPMSSLTGAYSVTDSAGSRQCDLTFNTWSLGRIPGPPPAVGQ